MLNYYSTPILLLYWVALKSKHRLKLNSLDAWAKEMETLYADEFPVSGYIAKSFIIKYSTSVKKSGSSVI